MFPVKAIVNYDTTEKPPSLSPPEIIDFHDIDYCLYKRTGGGGKEYDSFPDLEDYLDSLENPRELTIEKLKSQSLVIVPASKEESKRTWPIYKCLSFETKYQQKLYVFIDGSWFKVDEKLSQRVNDYYDKCTDKSVSLPDALKGEGEGDYNERAADGRTDFAMMDKKLVRPVGATSPVEICDIFTSKRQFVHVKKYHGSSAISHLLAQGMVSAEAFKRDFDFRKSVKEKVKDSRRQLASKIKTTDPTPMEYEVVFAIISKVPRSGNWPQPLPFFSLLNLMSTGRRISMLGYKISVVRIKEGH